jgi:hypothetical protein
MNTDYALVEALLMRPFGNTFCPEKKEDCDCRHTPNIVVSYDCACSYARNILERIQKNGLPTQIADLLEAIRFIIPALHIQDHKDDCMYAYSGSYMDALAQFKGELIETLWSLLNRAAPQFLQMNSGNRHDSINAHCAHQAWSKVSATGRSIHCYEDRASCTNHLFL